MIRLLDFFQTGQIAGLHVGVSRHEVRGCLGTPDDFLNPNLTYNGHIWGESNSPIWWYGGIEFAFDIETVGNEEAQPLQYIQFQPYYLYLQKWPTHIQHWIFRSRQGPTRQRLIAALTRSGILYQDIGLESVYYDSLTEHFLLTEYQSQTTSDLIIESFGTIKLQNGIQVRYAEDDLLISIQIGATWMI